MVKILVMMKRKNGLTPEEFSHYWAEKHAPLGFDILPEEIAATITRYIHNYVSNWSGNVEPQFDGIMELCFQDQEAFQKWMEWYMAGGGQALQEDEENFIDKSTVNIAFVEEKTFI